MTVSLVDIIPGHFGRDPDVLRELLDNERKGLRPILLQGGSVLTRDATMGDWPEADVLIFGSVIVAIGPGLSAEASDDPDTIVIDCKGTLVTPSRVDFTNPASSGSLTPGSAADIAVLRVVDAELTSAGPMALPGDHLDILIGSGRMLRWDGSALEPVAEAPPIKPGSVDVHPYLGMWVDEDDFIRQQLMPDGRYEEARGDRLKAYAGAYWVDGDRILYRDDKGFWAFGEFKDGLLLHAGYRFSRR